MSSAYAKRFEAVFLCIHPKGPKMPYATAAKYIRKSKAFVQKWVQRFKECKNLDDFPERGLKGKVTKRALKVILALFSKDSPLSLRQGQAKLRLKGVNISHVALREHLRANNLKWRSTLKKSLLSEKHIAKRRAWAQENIDRDWSNVIFSDECSVWGFGIIPRAWCSHPSQFVQRTVKHPVKVHLWGCFSKEGFGALHLFSENLNAARMVKIYRKALLPTVEHQFISKNEDWILQEDNDPKHRSIVCTEWKRENGIVTLDWPSQSPDANPIENVWSYLKFRLRGKRIFTLKQLIRQIRRIWRTLSSEYAENLVESMPRRCQAIIDAGGDWTHY